MSHSPDRNPSLGHRVKASLPTRGEVLLGSPIWAVGMAASAFVSLWLYERLQTGHLVLILAFYAAGALIAFPIALFLARFFGSRRRIDTRFAASFLSLAVCTLSVTAFLFSQQYRLFYAQWHGPFGSGLWLNQFVFTSASAVYQFIVSGLRLYLPLGIVEIMLASLWLAKRMR